MDCGTKDYTYLSSRRARMDESTKASRTPWLLSVVICLLCSNLAGTAEYSTETPGVSAELRQILGDGLILPAGWMPEKEGAKVNVPLPDDEASGPRAATCHLDGLGKFNDLGAHGESRHCPETVFQILLAEMSQSGMDGSIESTPPSLLGGAVERGSGVPSPNSGSSPSTNNEVAIPDSGLRSAIAAELGKDREALITAEEMASLEVLDAKSRGIRDLAGLRHATSLRRLDLQQNELFDIRELGELPVLTYLDLDDNFVGDLSPLANLVGLRQLSLAGNRIGDIELIELSSLHNLEVLDLSDNHIVFASGLRTLSSLTRLHLDRNQILETSSMAYLSNLQTLTLEDNSIGLGSNIFPWSGLSGLTDLRTLYLGGNGITYLGFLADLTNLEGLSLQDNDVEDVSALAGMERLELLDLTSNQIADIAPISGLTNLVLLGLRGNQISDISSLEGLEKLIGLDLADNNVTDASALAGLSHLVALDLDDNVLTAMPDLSALRQLRILSAESNGLADLVPLSGLAALATLRLGENQVANIEPLSDLSGLTTLWLYDNQIEDLAPLSSLTHLEQLLLSDNQISRIDPVEGLTTLRNLDLSSNPINYITPLSGLDRLGALGLNDTGLSDTSPLSGLVGLWRLGLSENEISDLSPLSGLTRLRNLNLEENAIEDISPLALLTGLSDLVLTDNEIEDISPVTNLTGLRYLSLSANDIEDLSALSGLTNLFLLFVRANEIQDLAPLVANSGLSLGDWVDVRLNPLGRRSILEHVPALRDRGVTLSVDGPDLVVDTPSANAEELEAETSFTLSVRVRNRGPSAAPSTTLRFYRSSDTAITLGDTEVGTSAVDGLAPLAEGTKSIELTSPSSAGTYYYGACIGTVSGESDLGNNCSESVRVEVSGDTGSSSPTLSATGRPGDQTYTVDTAIAPLTLPAATGGDGTLTYSLAPGVPGLSFDATTRQLSGTPTAAGTHMMSYTVTDSDGDTDTLSFTITVQASDGGTTEGECQVGQLVSPGESCKYPGTDDAFSVDDDGRGSFLVVSSARAINVNNTIFQGKRYDFRASHQGDGVWRIDRLEGSTTPPTGGGGGSNTSPAFPSNASPGDQTYTVGAMIATLTLPEATGGDGTLNYGLSPSIPGLSFDPATRELTGAPTAAGTHSMTYTVTDDDGDTDTLRFSVVVEDAGGGGADLSPSFAAGSGPGDQTYTVGTAIDALTLPEATGGDGALTYSLSREIPGLSFDAATRRLTGTPTTEGSYDLTYTVTDEDGDTDTLSFTITVQPVGGPTTDNFDLHPDNGDVEGIAYASSRFYVADSDDDKVYAYTAIGQRDALGDFDFHADNIHVSGMTFANEGLYVPDFWDDKVYVYDLDGQRDRASEFDLQSGNSDPSGIAYANMRFYVADWADDRVYAYTDAGQRDSAGDFDLHEDNDNSVAMEFANERLYVVDRVDEKVYAYTLDGRRDSASEFDLEEDNGNPQGITYANGRFYVPYDTDHRVYVYTLGETPSNGSGQSPDLVVESGAVDDATLDAGESFTFSATVRNRGDGQSGSTTLRYYRSTNSTISGSDTEVGTDAVAGLDAGGESRESITLTAPSSSGTYYYGACVDRVSGESDTGNNCSTGVRVTVSGGGGGGSIPAHPNTTGRFSPPSFFVGDPVDLVLSWNRVSGATEYKVYINNSIPISYTQRTTGCTVSSSHHSGTTTGTSYRYRFTAAPINQYYYLVQACNSGGKCSCP